MEPMTSEERIRALEHRASDIEAEIRRLDVARKAVLERTQDIGLGMIADAKLWLIALAVLAAISLAEAIAIALLWLR